MGTVWSGYTSTGTYTKTRVQVDYSGTSATAILRYTRTNTYTGSTGGTGTFSFGGKSVSYNKYFTGQQTDAEVARVSFSISTSGGYYSGSSTGAATYLAFNGGVTIPSQATNPTGLKATYSSCTWNSVTASASVSGWGGVSGSNLQFVLNSASNNFSNPRRAYVVATTGTSGSKTGTNSNYDWQYDSTFSLRGCKKYYLSGWCQNSAGLTAEYFDTTTRYLPPSPMTALSVTSQTGSTTANSVTVNFSTTGGNSTNNENVNVTTQFRYSTNNGSTWTAWANVGTAATPWTARTGSFTVPYGTATLLQTRQVYQSQASETKQISFTSTASTAPSGGTVSKTATTSNSVTVSGSITGFGTPSSVSTRSLTVGISSANGSTSSVRTASATAVSSTSAKLTSSSSGTLSIAANTAYTPYLVANNSLKSTTFWGTVNSAITCPPDISSLSVENIKAKTATLKYSYIKAGSALPESFVYIIDGVEKEITASTSGTIELTNLKPKTEYTISAYLKTSAGKSDNTKTVTFTTVNAAGGSKTKVNGRWVDNGKVYVKVNGTWKEANNLYVKVNGVWKHGKN